MKVRCKFQVREVAETFKPGQEFYLDLIPVQESK
jgi:hypothetical protein